MNTRQLLDKLGSRRGFLDLIYNTSPLNHYFRRSDGWHHTYLRQAYKTIMTVFPYCKQKEQFFSKLQLGREIFYEEQFLQDICEITIASHFAEILPDFFEYERKVSPPFDVDFSFCIPIQKEDDEKILCNYNFEVKCPKINISPEKEDIVKIHAATRFPSKDLKDNIVNLIKEKLHGVIEAVETPRHDNKLKDFLLSAQSKFKESDDHNVNVLIVCCDTELEMQNWRNYIVANGGFFTKNPILPRHEYNKTDVILLTNILNRHRKVSKQKKILLNPWEFNKSLNLSYIDPSKEGKWQISALPEFYDDRGTEFEDFAKNGNIPDGESDNLRPILSIAWFSDTRPDKCYFK